MSSRRNQGTAGALKRLGEKSYNASTEEVDALIQRARDHRLGVEFLADGAPDAIAATFQVHAFVVDAAREKLLN